MASYMAILAISGIMETDFHLSITETDSPFLRSLYSNIAKLSPPRQEYYRFEIGKYT